MQIQIVGRVERVGNIETKNSFSKKELWIIVDEDSDYPQKLCVEFLQKNMDRLNFVHEGDQVVVEADLRGREWNGKVFNSINGWKCTLDAPKPSTQNVESERESENNELSIVSSDEEDIGDFNDLEDEENLPF